MDGNVKKLEEEEKMIDQYEEILHNKTGIKWTLYLKLELTS